MSPMFFHRVSNVSGEKIADVFDPPVEEICDGTSVGIWDGDTWDWDMIALFCLINVSAASTTGRLGDERRFFEKRSETWSETLGAAVVNNGEISKGETEAGPKLNATQSMWGDELAVLVEEHVETMWQWFGCNIQEIVPLS